jgi:hypothetical protein
MWPRGIGMLPGDALLLALALLLLIVVVARPGGPPLADAQPVAAFDGQRYRVHAPPRPGATGAGEAADTLAAINSRVIDVMRALKRRYPRRGAAPGASPRHAAVARLLARYDPGALVENSPLDASGDTSFCVDKGAVLALCLRDRDPAGGDLHDLDLLTFVALHEVTHVAIDAADHPPEFWATFKWVLLEAEAAGVYTSPDLAAAPRTYCGLPVDYNPRWDPRARSI